MPPHSPSVTADTRVSAVTQRLFLLILAQPLFWGPRSGIIGGPKCWIWRGAPEAVHLVWILIPQELDLALGAPGVFEEFWRSDFWIRRGASEVVRLVLILILQELDLGLGAPEVARLVLILILQELDTSPCPRPLC